MVRASTVKNKKDEAIPLVQEVAQALREHRNKDAQLGDLVFPEGIPMARRLRKDLKLAGIQYRDELGRYADFHALRYTWATFLQRHGVAPRLAMKLMRHSDLKLTSKVYVDESGLPIHEAIKCLPSTVLKKGSRIGSHFSDSEGQNPSSPVSGNLEEPSTQPVDIEEVCPDLSEDVSRGQMG